MTMVTFTKREIYQQISNTADTSPAVHYILSKLDVRLEDVCSSELNCLKSTVSTLRTKYNNKYASVYRIKTKFEKKYSSWLDSQFHVPKITIIKDNDTVSSSISGLGRRSIPFCKKSSRSKRREAGKVSASVNHDPQTLIAACRYAVRRSGDKDLYAMLGKISESSERPKKIRKTTTVESPITPKTSQDALGFILDYSISKNVYTNMRLESKESGADIWPPYNNVRAVKTECRPPKNVISIKETEAEVPLQSLLNHTAERIVQLQKEVILHCMQGTNDTVIDAVLMCSWGFDGSSGHSTYKQGYQFVNADNADVCNGDGNIFATTLIPLQLLTTDSSNVVLWFNRTSQSARFCRPIKLQYVKESEAVIKMQKHNIDEQIDKLEVFEVLLDNIYRIRIHYSLFLTLIDGKVLNIITGTKSTQRCPICQAKPRQFNDLTNKSKDIFLPDSKSLLFGISPLHAWIRIFECCLHISYRINIKVWQVRGDKCKAEFIERKREIQAILFEKLGLIVDKPKPGSSGNSNDGNTARRAFKNPDLFAECLGLNSELLRNFKTILTVLSCQLPVNPLSFDKYCSRTAEIYVANYHWYPMSATLHKILIHGADIIRTSLLPVGMLGEEASEARNKHYKHYREFHSRKKSRVANLEDVFYRLMDTSDPVISTIRLNTRLRQKEKLPISKEVQDLLAIPTVNVDIGAMPSLMTNAVDASNDIENSDQDDDDDDDVNNSDLSETFKRLCEVELTEDEIDFET